MGGDPHKTDLYRAADDTPAFSPPLLNRVPAQVGRPALLHFAADIYTSRAIPGQNGI